ncbi:MAG: hypothetical protein ABIE43_04620 [Patescibacteria group bacterium]
MQPKVAIIILLVIVLCAGSFWTILYFMQQSEIRQVKLQEEQLTKKAEEKEREALTKEEIEKEKDEVVKRNVEKIMEIGKNEFGGITEGARQAAEDVVNNRIREKLRDRTPEQIEEDKKKLEEIEKLKNEINKGIETKLNN